MKRLIWEIADGVGIRSEHPVFHDEGSPLHYEVAGDGEKWIAMFEGTILGSGPIEDCIKLCNRDAQAAIRDNNHRKLLDEVRRLEQSGGGNWRRLKRLFDLRKQLESA